MEVHFKRVCHQINSIVKSLGRCSGFSFGFAHVRPGLVMIVNINCANKIRNPANRVREIANKQGELANRTEFLQINCVILQIEHPIPALAKKDRPVYPDGNKLENWMMFVK